MNYGKAFREIREETGLTRTAVAEQIGYTPSALSKIESGKVTPKEKTIAKFCVMAKIPLAYFYQRALSIEDYYWPAADGIVVGTPVMKTPDGNFRPSYLI